MSSVLITGANRGLGLEFARQYGDDGWRVIACCRNPERAEGLSDLAQSSGGRVSVHPLDVSERATIAALAGALRGEAIDILLNNAGVYGDEDHDNFGKIDYERWEETFRINVMGAMRMTEAFIENVVSSEDKILAFMSSLMGSISDNGSGGSYLYRSTKAALNAIAKSLSIDLKDRGVTAIVLHPGWVKTDMGGENAPMDPPESVAGMRRVLHELEAEHSGRFLSHAGAELPW
jgi:NAD(P)-dependent dehydrogenase (short-subunit alcohol dehydrogenase family)